MASAIPPRPRMRDRLKSILPRKSRPISLNPQAFPLSPSNSSRPPSTVTTASLDPLQVSQQSTSVDLPSSGSLQASTQTHLVPSTLNSSINSVLSPHTTNSVSVPTLGGPVISSSAASSISSTNAAFLAAIQKHINKLPEEERQAFRQANITITPDSLLERVRKLDTQHTSISSFRPHAEKIAKFLSLLDRLVGGIAIAIQANPDISSIAVGGVKLVVDIAMGFAKFFGKLTDMIDRLSGIIAPLERYAERSELEIVRNALVNIYGDILDFCKAASTLFLDRNGRSKVHATFDMFLRSQWKPFETEFGEINGRMDHHRRVLLEAAQAELLSAVVENKQRKERKYFFVLNLSQHTNLAQSKKEITSFAGCRRIRSSTSRNKCSRSSMKVRVTGYCTQMNSRSG
jgi:hypothetical protein